MDAAMVDGGKGKLYLLQHFVKQLLLLRGSCPSNPINQFPVKPLWEQSV